MRLAAKIIALFSIAALAAWGMHAGKRHIAGAADPVVKKSAEAPPTSLRTDPAEIFSKAFWQRPGPKDEILHAERREWADEHGVRKWQWFIVVDGSPELLKRLRDDNTFGLHPAASPPVFDSPPDWFRLPSEEVECMTSMPQQFWLIFSKNGRRIYATDSGGGFQQGAPEPVKNSNPPVSTGPAAGGRLPNSMPPKPIPPSP